MFPIAEYGIARGRRRKQDIKLLLRVFRWFDFRLIFFLLWFFGGNAVSDQILVRRPFLKGGKFC